MKSSFYHLFLKFLASNPIVKLEFSIIFTCGIYCHHHIISEANKVRISVKIMWDLDEIITKYILFYMHKENP